MASSPTTVAEPLLRTLAPALRRLQRELRDWLDAGHRFLLSTMTQAALEGLETDLRRQADALGMDRPLLVIMLMGGTGVGKSTLLNALAGGPIAQTSYTRPTTRDPVVYYHEAIKPDRLDPALRTCRLAPHDRPALEHKIIVDTPDLDSNDLANRERLSQLLPAADIVLYVGSQEKYHDQLGWELFLQQRRRRAFAFILNKWDRCLQTGTAGVRPDEDLLRDLRAQGFQNPLLFRTCAQYWVDHLDGETEMERNGETAKLEPGDGALKSEVAENPPEDTDGSGDSVARWVAGAESSKPRHPAQNRGFEDSAPATRPAADSPPEGEQFPDLVRWLEMGLTRMEIEAIKARGISQLLQHLEQALQAACPPDVAEVAGRTQAAWERLLAEESRTSADVLLNTLEPYQREIEHHFALENQRRFRGLMATYLHLVTRVKYVGSSLRDRVSLLPRGAPTVETASVLDLANFTSACSNVAGERHLDARVRALSNRLLVEADKLGFPLELLTEPTESAAHVDWRQRYGRALVEVLGQVEQQWAKPKGPRRWLQGGLIFLADWLPSLSLLGACLLLLWQYTMQSRSFSVSDFLLPVIALVIVLVLLHILIALAMPMRWGAMRGEFHRHLQRRLQTELENAYASIPADMAEILRKERRRVEQIAGQTREVAAWLAQREQAASIAGLYGN